MRHPGRRAGAERGPSGRSRRRLARDRLRIDGGPPVRLVVAGGVQRCISDPGRAPGCRRGRRRRAHDPGPDGLEPRRRRLGRREREDRRALADRPAGNLRRGDRRGVEPHARRARRLFARVPPAGGHRDRRRKVRAGDRADRGRGRRRARSLRCRRDAAARHVAREAGVAPARVQAGRRDHRRELELDRRRCSRDAPCERGGRGGERLRASGAIRLVRVVRRRPVPHAAREPGGVRACARESRSRRGTTCP